MNSRLIAAKIITAVIEKKKLLDDAIRSEPLHALSVRDQGFIRELCFGTFRYYERLEAISQLLLHKPIGKKNIDIFAMLLSALYQIIYQQKQPYVAISESIKAIKTKKAWASGLLNRILRDFCRNQKEILNRVDQEEKAKTLLPSWLLEQIKKDWPDYVNNIVQASNTKAPMFLRINPLQTSVENYLQKLHSAEIEATQIQNLPYAVQLKKAVPVSSLPGFEQGFCYIQDIAGQCIPALLQLKGGLTVLDACAAPGSKTTDLFASCPTLKKITALEKNPKRLEKIKQNFTRLRLDSATLQLILADSTQVEEWWNGEYFDRVLVDAPCSATGVIRRHPDIKILRGPNELVHLTRQQQQLLQSLWTVVKTGGLLLYATCSILQMENEQIIENFLQQHVDAVSQEIKIPGGIKQKYGVQRFPSTTGGDGFYYCLLKKCTITQVDKSFGEINYF